MLSIREIQEKTVGYFAGKGVPNPKLDADLLIAHVLKLKRLELYLDIDRPLTEAELNALRPLVKRRAEREPLQYILGFTEFYGMKLKTDARALIPRPETEELVEHVSERLNNPPKRILDLGTGSGAIAIALATLYPEAEVWATDQSEAALELAQENANAFVSKGRIHFHQGSWWEPLPEKLDFDLIVANPPYLTETEMGTAEPEVVAHEPAGALVSGEDGLDDLKRIIAGAKQRLAAGGMLALETGIAQHDALDKLVNEADLKGQGESDMSGRPRFYYIEASPVSSPSGLDGETRTDQSAPQTDWHPHPSPKNYPVTRAEPLREKRRTEKPVSPNEARYFITCCTGGKETGLQSEQCACAILTILGELHAEASIDLLAATVMPDHVHVLMKLGHRLNLSQVIGKFKAATRSALDENGLAWQENYHDHRLRADDALEKFSKYLFLNPYRSQLIQIDATWPWWVLNENYHPEFLEVLEDPPLPPEEWLKESPKLQELLEDDV
ncbi:peptide chain release factor N(5)-glutamine methyltransferase [Coraliomargarita sinensis]|uniref:Release factor glutamine methyltransferase n=1 Tax=Coraliomargarita sinensis TaxID=2174842 RepID=A0A317ZQ00_9BACT|nr:peptide chain release factor N(5)-glutamine methyltransferase [Coraliomargarita sinensis]PXA05491.1 peptide chain release factor N(5)-glutamine methyltransferase [Coraliomargarita sinensis]